MIVATVKLVRDHVPSDLVSSAEETRRDLLALFRALDRPFFARFSFPQKPLRQLMDLDGDLAEVLALLDRPVDGLRVKDMLDDTRRSLRRVPQAVSHFIGSLTFEARAPSRRHARPSAPRCVSDDALLAVAEPLRGRLYALARWSMSTTSARLSSRWAAAARLAEAKMTTLAPMHLAIPEFAPFIAESNGSTPSSHVENGV
jgi:hypothetical protein